MTTPKQVQDYLDESLRAANAVFDEANRKGDVAGIARSMGMLCGAIRCASSDLEFMQRGMDRTA